MWLSPSNGIFLGKLPFLRYNREDPPTNQQPNCAFEMKGTNISSYSTFIGITGEYYWSHIAISLRPQNEGTRYNKTTIWHHFHAALPK
jgi:hypothetical protein